MAALPERPYGAILVDEGQDFTPDWFVALESCLDGGPRAVFYVFHDTNNQTIRPGHGELPKDLLSFHLDENVRNTQIIYPSGNGSESLCPKGSIPPPDCAPGTTDRLRGKKGTFSPPKERDAGNRCQRKSVGGNRCQPLMPRAA
jgi:hypothetical protein